MRLRAALSHDVFFSMVLPIGAVRSHIIVNIIDQDWIAKQGVNNNIVPQVQPPDEGNVDLLDDEVELTPLFEVAGRRRFDPHDRSTVHIDGWRRQPLALRRPQNNNNAPLTSNSLIVVRSPEATEAVDSSGIHPVYTLGRWVRALR
jgi:hypothetical protein